MRVCVTGGREFREYRWLHDGLDLLNEVTGGITELIEGGAPGADTIAANWAIWRKAKYGTLIHTKVKAEWEKYSAGLKYGQKNPAGIIRNTRMIQMKPDIVLACPGGDGTADMVAQAKRAGIKVIFLEKMPLAKGAPIAERPSDPTIVAPAS